jgi:hypothetical protein
MHSVASCSSREEGRGLKMGILQWLRSKAVPKAAFADALDRLQVGILNDLMKHYSDKEPQEALSLASCVLSYAILREPLNDADRHYELAHREDVREHALAVREISSASLALSYLYAGLILHIAMVVKAPFSEAAAALTTRATDLEIYIPNGRDICGNSDAASIVRAIIRFTDEYLRSVFSESAEAETKTPGTESPDDNAEAANPLHELGSAILVAASVCMKAMGSGIGDDDPGARSRKARLVAFEYVIAFSHLTDREAFRLLGGDGRSILMDKLVPLLAVTVVDAVCEGFDAEAKHGFVRGFYDLANEAQAEYAASKDIASRIPFDEGTVAGKLGRRVARAIGQPFNPECRMRAMEVFAQQLREFELDSLIMAVAKSDRSVAGMV